MNNNYNIGKSFSKHQRLPYDSLLIYVMNTRKQPTSQYNKHWYKDDSQSLFISPELRAKEISASYLEKKMF